MKRKLNFFSVTLDVSMTVILIMWHFHTPEIDNSIFWLPYLRTTPGKQQKIGKNRYPVWTKNLKNRTLLHDAHQNGPYMGVSPSPSW